MQKIVSYKLYTNIEVLRALKRLEYKTPQKCIRNAEAICRDTLARALKV